MNKLFEMFDRYVDEKILAKTNQLEGSQILDANRIFELEQAIEDFEYKIDKLECSIEDMVKDYVDTALVKADLGDIDSCEVERIVRRVLDEIKFKVTVER